MAETIVCCSHGFPVAYHMERWWTNCWRCRLVYKVSVVRGWLR